MNRNCNVIIIIIIYIISKYLYFKKAFLAIFAAIIKIVDMFLKTFLKTQKQLKELEVIHQNAIYICISWHSKICRFPLKKC